MITLKITTQSAICQMQHNTWQGSHYSASSTAPKLTTACRWQTNVRWKCLLSILLAKPLPTKELQKVSADLCLRFQAPCASTWTQLSRLTNALNTWIMLESQPKTLGVLRETFGHSSSAFARQDLNWQLKSATMESDELNSKAEPFLPREYHHNLTKFKTS